MPRKKSIRLRCPICRQPVKASDPEFPFCSERCRTIDLGKWSAGEYVVSSPIHEEDELDSGPQQRPIGHDEDKH